MRLQEAGYPLALMICADGMRPTWIAYRGHQASFTSLSRQRARGPSIGWASRTSQGRQFRMSFDISALYPGC